MKKERPGLDNLVPHPRYHCLPEWARAGEPVLEWAEYQYRSQWIFPETALPADVEKQSSSPFPQYQYIDVLKQCRDCKRHFVFFAKEQKHWYEELGFSLDADCVRCCECRKHDQLLRNRFRSYSDLTVQEILNNDQLETLVSDAVILWRHGILTREDKVRRLLNRAKVSIPKRQATADLQAAIEDLE